MKKFFTNAMLAGAMLFAGAQATFAQITPTTISAIQTVSATRLQACDDAPSFLGDTVSVTGVVTTDGGLAQSGQGRQLWIREIGATGPWQSIGVRVCTAAPCLGTGAPTTPDDMLTLIAGDTVEFTGVVEVFQGETQLAPIQVGGVQVIAPYQPGSPKPAPFAVNLTDLMNTGRQQNLVDGEKWEGAYVELTNMTVTDVTFFSNNTRVSMWLRGANNIEINISDRFLVQRMANGQVLAGQTGTFVPPTVGDVFDTIRGVILHSNQCAAPANRGYEINPWQASDYVRGAQGPSIASVARNITTPCTQNVIVTAAAAGGIDANGVPLTISSATLFYAVGNAPSYNSIIMTSTGTGIYEGTIPGGFPEGTYVRYYVSITNSASQTVNNPNIASVNPFVYLVRCGSLQIRDIQFTPFQSGGNMATGENGHANSIFTGEEVTVEGVVTASAEPGNLGHVFIQQENETQWAGLWLIGGTLNNLTVGQKVRVTGTVQENFNWTRLAASTVQVIGTGNITPLVLPSTLMTQQNYNTTEPYEGMLVTIEDPTSPIFVVQTPADASNQGEFRVGPDTLDETNGTRIITGRNQGSSYSSLNVSYIVSSTRPASWGTINVPEIEVAIGDSFTSITGVMQYTFSNWKLAPRNNADFTLVTSNRALVNNNLFAMYPNPATSAVTFTFASGNNMSAYITDMTGRVVAQKSNLNSNDQMSINNLSSGQYVVSIATAEGKVVSRSKLSIIK